MSDTLKSVIRDVAPWFIGVMIAWLLFSVGLDFLWLGKPLIQSFLHWAPSFLGGACGVCGVRIVYTLFMLRNTPAPEQHRASTPLPPSPMSAHDPVDV